MIITKARDNQSKVLCSKKGRCEGVVSHFRFQSRQFLTECAFETVPNSVSFCEICIGTRPILNAHI